MTDNAKRKAPLVIPAQHPARFSISYARGAYKVSIPNYAGGEVVRADVVDKLRRALEHCVTRLYGDLEEIRHLRGWLSDSERRERASQDEAADEADENAIADARFALSALNTSGADQPGTAAIVPNQQDDGSKG